MRLVDLQGEGLARLGGDSRLISGSYETAQRWSRALWIHPARPDGIRYRSRHDPSRISIAVFDRAGRSIRAAAWGGLLDDDRRAVLGRILKTYGFGLLGPV